MHADPETILLNDSKCVWELQYGNAVAKIELVWMHMRYL